MSGFASALYTGTVMHRRLRPRPHRLQYRVFSLLLDLDEIEAIARRLRWFSRNRFNLFSWRERDCGDGSDTPLRAQLEAHMRAAGLDPDGGPIRLLTMPRILGYAFNPLNVYFCYRGDGALAAILYEVNNTFGERHSYLLPVEARTAGGLVRQHCAKRFYVSPFLDMEMAYAFRVVPPKAEPGSRLTVSITGSDKQGPIIVATLAAERVALTDRALARVFLIYPLLTLKVIAGIHWEALWIWLKGARLRAHPAPPPSPVSIGAPGSHGRPEPAAR